MRNEGAGHPALDPVVLFKLLLIGYLFVHPQRAAADARGAVQRGPIAGSSRLKLNDKVPGASTLSQSRRRRFRDTDVYQQTFDQIVELACRMELVTGKVLYCSTPTRRT